MTKQRGVTYSPIIPPGWAVSDPALLFFARLAAVDIPEGHLGGILGASGARRAQGFATAKDRDEFVSGRVALRRFAASLLAVDPSRLTPDYDCPQCGRGQDHGRPGFLLDGGPAPLLLSASRASGWVLLAGVVHPAKGLRLGVDLEAASEVGFAGFDDVALTAREREAVDRLPDGQRDNERARLWARKEAWLKMTGEGLRRNPAGLDVLDREGLMDLDLAEGTPGLVAALALA